MRLRKQHLFSVEWSGYIENDWKFDKVTANNYAEAEQAARSSFPEIRHIKSIRDTHEEVYAPCQSTM